ncbi:exosortase/archaeosortase family protein [Flaviramulus sp. BrNp1-15]|uniref:archaeosortase/exosortase family protein n=1 Tax=Flaviramulus sp. BrNp1-15 TaxID=2916754 RepID=UPI001EE93E14|nr:archaeosortase/exosortase family protein [Flaviramulus sp. BrNp1-15]ULC58308.1 exosortase/archaeosortase family protein [Flaviramulus sp. BrNp1-15]
MIKISSLKNKIPLPIRLFLGKAFLLFVIWKIIYSFFLYDSKVLDYPLTTHVAEASTKFLNSSGFLSGFSTNRTTRTSVYEGELISHEASEIFHNNKLVLYIADGCNGLELMVLYIGFIICMPSKIWRKILYIILGVALLDIINILRCVGLIYLREYFQAYFQFAHHYLFKVMVYGATFLIWKFYSRKIQFKNELVQVG